MTRRASQGGPTESGAAAVRPESEAALAALAAALAGPDAPMTAAERALTAEAPPPSPEAPKRLRAALAQGGDPLGDAFCRLRPPSARRALGAVYTPPALVDAMVGWAAGKAGPPPARAVDPGAGSGRFLLAAARAFPDAALAAVEIDPLAALILRANAAARGLADRLTVTVGDYRDVDLPRIDGKTLFLGNPPYVRHHDMAPEWKDRFAAAAAARGLKASRLAGLHVHFLFRTRALARPGDYGAFVTSAEWLDTNYGDAARKLLAGDLGGEALHALAPEAAPFADAATTGVVVCFRVGRSGRDMRLRSVPGPDDLGTLSGGRPVPRSRLAAARGWSPLLRPSAGGAARAPGGAIELGEICRVHRGQATGCNAAWIAGAFPGPLPESVLFPAVTKARELFDAAPGPLRPDGLRRAIDLPADLDALDGEDLRRVLRFLEWARAMGADRSWVARHRRAWWAVGLRAPAPILATYMARRPPAFVRNPCGARHLNIAHGLYPRARLPERALDALAAWLNGNVGLAAGRAYAGGLVKFEPRELERVAIPPLEELHERTQGLDARRTKERYRRRTVPAQALRAPAPVGPFRERTNRCPR